MDNWGVDSKPCGCGREWVPDDGPIPDKQMQGGTYLMQYCHKCHPNQEKFNVVL